MNRKLSNLLLISVIALAACSKKHGSPPANNPTAPPMACQGATTVSHLDGTALNDDQTIISIPNLDTSCSDDAVVTYSIVSNSGPWLPIGNNPSAYHFIYRSALGAQSGITIFWTNRVAGQLKYWHVEATLK